MPDGDAGSTLVVTDESQGCHAPRLFAGSDRIVGSLCTGGTDDLVESADVCGIGVFARPSQAHPGMRASERLGTALQLDQLGVLKQSKLLGQRRAGDGQHVRA